MQIKASMTFRWKDEMPEFKEGRIYDLPENLALEMIKHGYAEEIIPLTNCDEKLNMKIENKMIDSDIENKMVDISSKSKAKRIKILKKNKK